MASGGFSGKGNGEGDGKRVHWLAEDVCQTIQGSEGKPAAKPRTRKSLDCRNCGDLCCSLSRALVSEAFELGVIDMSRKVSLILN